MTAPLTSKLATCPEVLPAGEEAYQFLSEISITPLKSPSTSSSFRIDDYLSGNEKQYGVALYQALWMSPSNQWAFELSPKARDFLVNIPNEKKSLVCLPDDWQVGQPLGLKQEAIAVFQQHTENSNENPAGQALTLAQLDEKLASTSVDEGFLQGSISYQDYKNPQLDFKQQWSEFPLALSNDEAFVIDQILNELHPGLGPRQWLAPLKDAPQVESDKFLYSNYLRESDLRFLSYQIQIRFLNPKQKNIAELKKQIGDLKAQAPTEDTQGQLITLDQKLDGLERTRFRLLALLMQLEEMALQRQQATQSGTAVKTDADGKIVSIPNVTLASLSGNNAPVLARPFSLELNYQAPKSSAATPLHHNDIKNYEQLGHFFEEDIQWLGRNLGVDTKLLFRRVPDGAADFEAGTYFIVKDYYAAKNLYDRLKPLANNEQKLAALSSKARSDLNSLVQSLEKAYNKFENYKILTDSKVSIFGYGGAIVAGAVISSFFWPSGDWLRSRFFNGVSRLLSRNNGTGAVWQTGPDSLVSGQRALPPSSVETPSSTSSTSPRVSPASRLRVPSASATATGITAILGIVAVYFQYNEYEAIKGSSLPQPTKDIAKVRPLASAALSLDLMGLLLTGSKLAGRLVAPLGLIVTELEARHQYNLSASQNPDYSPTARENVASSDTANTWITRGAGGGALVAGGLLAVIGAPLWLAIGGAALVGTSIERVSNYRDKTNHGRAWADSVTEILEEYVQLKQRGKPASLDLLNRLLDNPYLDEEAVFELLNRLRDKDILRQLDWAGDPQLAALRDACYQGLKSEYEAWTEAFGDEGAAALIYFGMQNKDPEVRKVAKQIYMDEVGDEEGPLVDFYRDYKIPESQQFKISEDAIQELVEGLTGG